MRIELWLNESIAASEKSRSWNVKDPFDTATEDFIARRMTPRRPLEKDIQKACVDWARECGWWARKFVSPANRSVPDYLFSKMIDGKQYAVAVEFKAPGKLRTLTTVQKEEQEAMRYAGWLVVTHDNVYDFMAYFEALEFA